MNDFFFSTENELALAILCPLDVDWLYMTRGQHFSILEKLKRGDPVLRVEDLLPISVLRMLKDVVSSVIEIHSDQAERHIVRAEFADCFGERGTIQVAKAV